MTLPKSSMVLHPLPPVEEGRSLQDVTAAPVHHVVHRYCMPF